MRPRGNACQLSRFSLALSAIGITLGLMAILSGGSPLCAEENASSLVQTAVPSSAVPEATKIQAQESYGRLPLAFEINRGQSDRQVRFLARGGKQTLFLTPTEAVLALHGREDKAQTAKGKVQKSTTIARPASVLRLRLVDANPTAQITGVDELPGKMNYLHGNNPQRWQTNIATYAKVKYAGIDRGIDLIYYGNQRQLEYDFVVAPGANPRAITLEVSGAQQIEVDAQGDLLLHTATGVVRQRKPVVYQDLNGVRQEITGSYVRTGRPRVGFQVAAYDHQRPVVIDPIFLYAGYLGGSGSNPERGSTYHPQQGG